MDFEEWFSEYDEKHQCYPEKRECFEAGQQIKQAEIDELKMSNHYLSVQVLDAESYAEYWQKRSNESQAEIEALKNKMQTALNKACMLQNSSGERIYTELKELLK